MSFVHLLSGITNSLANCIFESACFVYTKRSFFMLGVFAQHVQRKTSSNFVSGSPFSTQKLQGGKPANFSPSDLKVNFSQRSKYHGFRKHAVISLQRDAKYCDGNLVTIDCQTMIRNCWSTVTVAINNWPVVFRNYSCSVSTSDNQLWSSMSHWQYIVGKSELQIKRRNYRSL